MQRAKLIGEIDWECNLSALYYDLAGSHSPEAIRMLLTITSPNHLLYGSDYPYVVPQAAAAGLQRMKGYLGLETDIHPYMDMILGKNAQQLFSKSISFSSMGDN